MNKVLLCAAVVGLATASSALADAHAFPSSSSTVSGALGFVSPTEVGYFWSVSRGDAVSETMADSYASVNQAIIDVEIPFNILRTNCDWEVLINSTVVDSFSVAPGDSFVLRNVSFPSIAAIAGAYSVEYRVTNEVPGGDGSHTFAYAGDFKHSIELIPTPGAMALLGLGGLAAARRRR